MELTWPFCWDFGDRTMNITFESSRHALRHGVIAGFLFGLVPTMCFADDWFVDASVSSPGAGTSWSSPFKYLRNALENSSLESGDVIRIRGATGTGLIYYPDQYWSGSTTVDTNNVDDSFIIDGTDIGGNIQVIGQHTGNPSDPEERDSA